MSLILERSYNFLITYITRVETWDLDLSRMFTVVVYGRRWDVESGKYVIFGAAVNSSYQGWKNTEPSS